ncbi:MAG: hypothetical protein J0H35_03205 [Rhodospirillales bacterium]|nr:hypothetical protein [Rhodospirillales bacterium]
MRPWLLLPLLLAGCGVFGPKNDSARAECEWQANNDPKVVELRMKRFSQTTQDSDLDPDIAVAKHDAILRCLQAKGLALPGGVQAVRPRI